MYTKPMLKAEFQAFYDKHFDRVYRFVFYRVNKSEDKAQDLTSEIFMKALEHFDGFDERISKTAWIMTIARNHISNHYRDLKENVNIENIQFSLEGEDGRKKIEKIEELRELKESLDKLSARDKQLIELKYIQGYRYKEIGDILGKSAGAARVESHRAMRKLRQLLLNYEQRKETT